MMLSNCTGCPIRRLVLNDISPFVPKEGVARLVEYVGTNARSLALPVLCIGCCAFRVAVHLVLYIGWITEIAAMMLDS